MRRVLIYAFGFGLPVLVGVLLHFYGGDRTERKQGVINRNVERQIDYLTNVAYPINEKRMEIELIEQEWRDRLNGNTSNQAWNVIVDKYTRRAEAITKRVEELSAHLIETNGTTK